MTYRTSKRPALVAACVAITAPLALAHTGPRVWLSVDDQKVGTSS